MVIYVIKRLIYMIPVLLGVALVISFILYLTPGDPTDIILSQKTAEDVREAWRDLHGLNDPFWVQYFHFIGGIILHWDWGTSLVNGQSVTA
ncbi:MAG: ABC transporter permease, partial [Clostridiales Family XIII bacterium]|nr:ABC transporter permease [Clostridiales Family XIII bacterium]